MKRRQEKVSASSNSPHLTLNTNGDTLILKFNYQSSSTEHEQIVQRSSLSMSTRGGSNLISEERIKE